MYYIGTTHAATEALLAQMAEHLPPGIDLGSPRVASGANGILCADGGSTSLIGLDPDGGAVWRIAELVGGLVELTDWSYGIETSRKIVRGDADGNDVYRRSDDD